jgi:hypothetical protein
MMTQRRRTKPARIGEMLVSQKLAACVQVLSPMQSIYVWKSEVQRESEVPNPGKDDAKQFCGAGTAGARDSQLRDAGNHRAADRLRIQVLFRLVGRCL